MITYVDTSATAKLLINEPESGHVHDRVLAAPAAEETLVSSRLMATELHRIAFREGLEVNQVQRVIAHVHLIDVDREIVDAAGRLPVSVRTLDAIHLATLELLSERPDVSLWTYDERMSEAATQLGWGKHRPG